MRAGTALVCLLLACAALGRLRGAGGPAPAPDPGPAAAAAAAAAVPPPALFVVRVRYGLSNRLRALASAAALARASRRRLCVVWPTDTPHMRAPLGALLDLRASGLRCVLPSLDAALLPPALTDVYDYSNAAVEAPPIDLGPDPTPGGPPQRHIVATSAVRLVSPALRDDDVNAELRRLVPSDAVAALLAAGRASGAVPGALFVGVHVRNVSPRADVPGLPADAYSAESWAVLEGARARCNVTSFAKEMARLRAADGSVHFFVAGDNAADVAALVAAFGPAASTLGGAAACPGRETRCVQLALAELLALGRAAAVLGSYYSSFSEVAARLAGVPARYAGEDF